MVLFLIGGHPVDLVGGDAVLDLTVRGLNEAVLVHASVQRQGADQADVGAFGRLDGAHTRVVRVVNVADGRSTLVRRLEPDLWPARRRGRARTDGAYG